MLDLAWSEIAIIGLVAVVVLGPKELPKALRSLAQFMKKARKLAGEFQGHWNEMVREAELEDVKKTVQQVTNMNVGQEVEKFIDPTGEFTRDLKDSLNTAKAELEGANQSINNAVADIQQSAAAEPGAAATPAPAVETPALAGEIAAPAPAAEPPPVAKVPPAA
jgi:sec-independent protein translocase protein TatB